MTATYAIIPASGLGRRLGRGTDKAFVEIGGRPLAAHTLAAFEACSAIDGIVLVVRRENIAWAQSLVSDYGFTKVTHITAGGDVRQDSVRNGLAQLPPECDIVAIHDAARPLIPCDVIVASIAAARQSGAAIVAVPVIDTIKCSPDGECVRDTLDRGQLFAVQTPQTFTRDVIESAYARAYEDGFVGTDDASLVERLGQPVRIVRGSYENIKVTTPSDISTAESILARRAEESMPSPEPLPTSLFPRIGHGYDIHRFAHGRRLFLGGVEFEGEEGLFGHSDADVLIHAVADALLGAAGAGDIGRHFPDTDQSYKDVRSTILLSRVGEVISELGWLVGNIDVTLIAEHPRVSKRVPEMCATIASALSIDPSQVSIKATTAEGLGAIGERLGIECHAVALLLPTGM